MRGDGDCLRLRDAAGLSGGQISCLADGSTLQVLEGSVSADGYVWQRVRAHGIAGWVAAKFLEPVPLAPACGTQGAGMGPGLLGWIPDAGFGLVIWGGGTVHGMANAAAVRGCSLRVVWANKTGGGYVAYVFGAPNFANARVVPPVPGRAHPRRHAADDPVRQDRGPPGPQHLNRARFGRPFHSRRRARQRRVRSMR